MTFYHFDNMFTTAVCTSMCGCDNDLPAVLE